MSKKTEYVMHIRNLKPALNHGLVLKKVHKMIKFNKNARLKPCIDMNKDQRKKAKHDFHEWILMNIAVFEKETKKIWWNIEILNLSQQKEEETIYYQNQIIILQRFFTENLLAIEMKKIEILMNKPVHLRLSVLELSKMLMYLVWLCKTKIWWKSKIRLY